MQYLVNDYGDGCCIEIGLCHSLTSLIDFGSKLSGKLPKKGGFFRRKDWDKLIISHYHTDHYNQLYQTGNNSIGINELIYPHIPKIIGVPGVDDEEILLKFVLFFNMLSVFDDCGIPSYGLINLLNKKVKTTHCNFLKRRVMRGDQIDIYNESYQVIWPPEFITRADSSSKKILSRLEEIHDIIKKNDFLKELWEEFEVKYSKRNTASEDSDEKSYAPDMLLCEEKYKKNKVKIKPIAKRLSKVIRDEITNRLSICLYKKDTFLFLGDLEEEEIKACIDHLKNNYNINHINLYIAPHHGTHWDDRLLDIYAENVVISNGKERVIDFKEKFKDISGSCFHTFLCGDIFIDDEDWTVRLKKLWWFFRP